MFLGIPVDSIYTDFSEENILPKEKHYSSVDDLISIAENTKKILDF